MIPMSADEIKEYWNDYCDRKGVTAAARAQGNKMIEDDPERWADQSMPELLEEISRGKAQ
ncbi:MAG: hypothetical protein EXR31_08330 [Betaproteobacteria bacterium]|nr:hypothetical protein [Betaproteobacteria bacterium]